MSSRGVHHCKMSLGDSIKFVQSDDEHNYAFRAGKYTNDQGMNSNLQLGNTVRMRRADV